ncbi:chemotaxis protein CheW [Paracraurococcus lichenis]|uniref:Chemotaxis protein CheW n=1 Tax=Paracraurococcus lichenis TaxID=3064888 RepID=A0ABT9EDG1_9PROT|nr:chemotaxis protein CheW [Paracraurococcus sp. LOR1-02]MDO9714229.1 chemotaxis protein CheW [Paracraurococcus sp. LOR1-02]
MTETARDIRSQSVSVVVAGQSWGIPIAAVREVLGPQAITPVPLAPPAVAGSLNLRGRIVTVLDLRTALGLPPTVSPERATEVVVEQEGNLYSLLIDEIGDAMDLAAGTVEAPPQTMDARWRALATGIVKLDGRLLLLLDLDRLLGAVGTA